MQTNPLAGLSLQQLKRAVAIREKVEGLERELDRIISGKPVGKGSAGRRKGRRAASRGRVSNAVQSRSTKAVVQRRMPSRRGGMKERIIRALRAAGDKGATVKDLAGKLGRSYGSISVWFHTTGKRVKEIKKMAPGGFAWAA
jgi:hypothetical protein